MKVNEILDEVRGERWKQEAKWGPKNRVYNSVLDGLAVLMEEVGEVARAELENDLPGVRRELIQVAAVAVAMVEGIEKRLVPWQ